MVGLLEAKIAEMKHMVSEFHARMEERARLRRVKNHPHKPGFDCMSKGDITHAERREESNGHTIEVFECSECHLITEYDQTQRIGDAIGTFGLWH